MNMQLTEQYGSGFTSEKLGAAASAAKAAIASLTSELTYPVTSIAPRQHDGEDSLASAWLMIGTILGTLVIMMVVVLGTATSIH